MAFIHSPKIITDGLVFALDAANNKSYPRTGTTWNDLSGNNITTTLTNGPTFSTTNNGIITFDAVDDYCIFDTSRFPSGNSPLTIETWFRRVAGNTVIFGYGLDTTDNNAAPYIGINASIIPVFLFGSNGVTATGINIANTWYQVVGTYNTTQAKIYINGVLNNTANYSTANITLNNGVNGNFGALGALFSGFGNVGTGSTRRYGTFNGSISITKLYNRALTDNEILQNFNATRSRFGI